MLRNYLTIATRTLWKHRGLSGINLVGLAVSLAVCLLVLLFLRQQWRYDRWHDAADRIHRVTSTLTESGRHYATSPAPLGPALADRVPGVKATVHMDRGTAFARRDGQPALLVDALYADASFFDVFDFRLKSGDAATALTQPGGAVLTPSLAERLFGTTESVVGRTFAIRDSVQMTVTGLLAPPGGPSHFQFEALYAWATLEARPDRQDELRSWTDVGGQYNYILLAEGTSPADVEAQLAALRAEHLTDKEARQVTFGLQALTDINLGERMWNEIRYGMLPWYVAAFLAALAAMILIAAGFNYVNLSVARSLRRRKEIGVRKSMGAGRIQLVGQFLGESVLMSLLATSGAVLLLSALVPMFNDLYVIQRLLEIPLTLDPVRDPMLVPVVLSVGVGVGLLAGLYPATVLSAPEPTRILRPSVRGESGSRIRTRKALIALQFVLTLVFAVTAVMLTRQASYALSADHGFSTDRLIRIRTHAVDASTFRREAEGLSNVASVTLVSNVPLSGTYAIRDLRVPSAEDPVEAYSYAVDSTFVGDMDVAWAARLPDALPRFATGAPVLLNRRAVRDLGFESPDAALGQVVHVGPDETPRTIVGVVQGVHVRPVMDAIQPLVLRHAPEQFQNALVRAQSDDLAAVTADLRDVWTRMGATDPLNPQYFSEILRMKYGPLQDAARITGVVAFLAVLIAALGLLGIAAYTVETRTKEIGIRKALGASATDVVWRLASGFVGLAAGGLVLAIPLAWALNRVWLQAFAYHVEMGVWTFAACGIALLGLALTVVATQALRAARLNPATTLRDE